MQGLTHVEYDHYACKSLRTRMKHYGYLENEISVLEKDITDKDIIEQIELEVSSKSVDLLIGGPPCQSFSSLGRAKDENGMQDDPRNYLFESYEKILNHFKPKIFVFENVTGLLTAKLGKEKTVNIILKKLGQDYKLIKSPNDMVLNSCDYGVPQVRKRIILIGVRKNIGISVSAPKPKRQALKAIASRLSIPKRCGAKPAPHKKATSNNMPFTSKGEDFIKRLFRRK